MTSPADESFEKVVQDHLRGFLRSGVTGCAFAQSHAKSQGGPLTYGVHVGPVDSDVPEEIESLFDAAARERAAAVVVFPELRTALDVCDLLALLAGRARWQIRRASWKKHKRADLLVSMLWTTASGEVTSVMGLAPLGSMPATRRAPYVALVAWTGGRENEHWTKQKPGEVSLVDMPLPEGMSPAKYRTAFASTRRRVKRLKSVLREGAAEPYVAFCLPAECGELLPDV